MVFLREFARYRKQQGLNGGTLRAVQKARDAGRLPTTCIRVGDTWRITDMAAACAEWDRNTDLTRAPADAVERAESPRPAVDSALIKACNAELRAELLDLRDRCKAAPGMDSTDLLDLDEVFAVAAREFAS